MNSVFKWWWRVAFATVAIAGAEAMLHLVFGGVPYAESVQAMLQVSCIMLVHAAVIVRIVQYIGVEDADAG